MSYITTMAVTSGIIMAADRQVSETANIIYPSLETENAAFENVKKQINSYLRPLSRTFKKLFTMGDNIGINMGQAMHTNKNIPVGLYVDYFCRSFTFDEPQEAAQKLFSYLCGIDINIDTILYLAGYNKKNHGVLTPEIYRISIKDKNIYPMLNLCFHYAGYNDYISQYVNKINENIFHYSLQDAVDICNFAIYMSRTLSKFLDFNSGISEDIEMIAITPRGVQWLKKAELEV